MGNSILNSYNKRRGALLQNQRAFDVAGAGGSRYAERYSARGSVGAAAPGGNCRTDWNDGMPGGRLTNPRGPSGACTPLPPRCDCHVIGANTVNSEGILSGATGTLDIDSGDASYFVPYYIAVVAYQVLASDTGLLANPGTPLMALLLNSVSGREPNMRRASGTDPTYGVWTSIYGFEKDLECVDWKAFSSTNNQRLTLTLYNPNNVDIHVFLNIWGLAAA